MWFTMSLSCVYQSHVRNERPQRFEERCSALKMLFLHSTTSLLLSTSQWATPGPELIAADTVKYHPKLLKGADSWRQRKNPVQELMNKAYVWSSSDAERRAVAGLTYSDCVNRYTRN